MNTDRDDYRADIDGLRAVAVLAVMSEHANLPHAQGGYLGVDVFFVISGYLITSIVQRDVMSGGFSFRRFYTGRIRRLLPAYIAVTLVTTIACHFLLLPEDYKFYAASLAASYVGLSNIFFSMLSTSYFSPRMELFPLLHTWSLAIEEQFYVAWPLLVLIGFRLRRWAIAPRVS